MEGISDIRISSIDEMRPPRILKEPYINLYFKLTHKAPKKWCEDFNHLVAKGDYPVKIEPNTGLFIETWVRKPEEIARVFEGLKLAVSKCKEEYIARINAEAKAAAQMGDVLEEAGEQGRLNKIIAGLDFDE